MIDALHQVMVEVKVPSGVATPAPDGTPARATTSRQWGPCNFQPVSSNEMLQGQHTVTGEFFASGPLAQWIIEGSTVVLDSTTYRLKGLPKHFSSGVLDHTELTLVIQKG